VQKQSKIYTYCIPRRTSTKQAHLSLPRLHVQPPSPTLHPLDKVRWTFALKDSPVRPIQPNAGVSGGVTGPSSRWDSGSRLYGDRIPRPLPPTQVKYVPYPSSSSDDTTFSRLACLRSREAALTRGPDAFISRNTHNLVTRSPRTLLRQLPSALC
jgi:hypothetical protein